mgnify:CR=1 FL=1
MDSITCKPATTQIWLCARFARHSTNTPGRGAGPARAPLADATSLPETRKKTPMTEKISTINVCRGYLIPDLQAPRKSWVRTFSPQSLALLGITALGLTACQSDWGRRPDASATPAPAAQTTNLSPAHWPASDLDEFVALESRTTTSDSARYLGP